MANCISVNHDYIFCGCADGTVRIFNPLNLHFVTTLPKPHFLGTDIASVTEARYCGEGGREQGRLVGVRTVPQTFAIYSVLFFVDYNWQPVADLPELLQPCLAWLGYSPKLVAGPHSISCSSSPWDCLGLVAF